MISRHPPEPNSSCGGEGGGGGGGDAGDRDDGDRDDACDGACDCEELLELSSFYATLHQPLLHPAFSYVSVEAPFASSLGVTQKRLQR